MEAVESTEPEEIHKGMNCYALDRHPDAVSRQKNFGRKKSSEKLKTTKFDKNQRSIKKCSNLSSKNNQTWQRMMKIHPKV